MNADIALERFIAYTAFFAASCAGPQDAQFMSLPSPSELVIDGDPRSTGGARWTFRGQRNGVTYDLAGVLYQPSGTGPFPAVILSHGAGGNAARYAQGLAGEFVKWGVVGIAVNYTHSSGVATGAPGTADEQGASPANVLRARMTYEVLRALGGVDTTRIAAHGHSMGAFVTVALVGAYPTLFRVASQTSGGLRSPRVVAGPAPSEAQADGIVTPFQIHHGGRDEVVDVSSARRLADLLTRNGVEHQLHVYAGADHTIPARSPEMLARLRGWYLSHGLLR